jgi:hypothetical protein
MAILSKDVSKTHQLVGSPSSLHSATVNDMHSSSISSSYKYFDKARTEKKLRRYKLYNNNNNNNNNSKINLSTPIKIQKANSNISYSSYDDNESVLIVEKTDSESGENDDVYDNKEFNLNKNYKLLKKKMRKHDKKCEASGSSCCKVGSLDSVCENIVNNPSTITTINEINEINLDFPFNNDDDDDDRDGKENNISTVVDNQLDIDNYLDKLELNILGNINN